MTWFKVDDKLHSHRKAARAGIAAMGLWCMAGSWCADQLTDGFIPDYMAQRMDSRAEQHAAALVTAGLWVEAEVSGDRGWQFRDWSEHQPTREQVQEDRAAARERMRRVRANTDDGSTEVRANKPRSSEAVTGEVRQPRPVPSRPVPSGTSTASFNGADAPPNGTAKTTADPDGFTAFWAAFPRRQGKGEARKAWREKRCEPIAAQVIAGAERYRDDPNRADNYTKMPAGWLRAERWSDDPLPRRAPESRAEAEQQHYDSLFDRAGQRATARDGSAPFGAIEDSNVRQIGAAW